MEQLKRGTVWWLDAHGGNDNRLSESELEMHHKPMLLATTGWIWRDDDLGITVLNEWFPEDDPRNEGLTTEPCRGVHFIYRGMVERVEYLD